LAAQALGRIGTLSLTKLIRMPEIDYRIQKLINKEVKIPTYLDDFNSIKDYWYPHPPCLIPLFLGYGAAYKGLVKHFFCERKTTYVEYTLEHGYMAEIARNADQLITLMVLRMIITKDGLTNDIIDFCKQLDYHEYETVDQFTVDYGDDPKDFEHLPYFNISKPFKYLRNLAEYDGDYPSSIYILNTPDIVQNSSLYEIAVDDKIKDIGNLSPWLINNGDKNAMFYQYLEKNQFKEAWFTLNSKGWAAEDLAIALRELKNKSGNTELASVADHWIQRWEKSLQK
jgi:hypothetical protein